MDYTYFNLSNFEQKCRYGSQRLEESKKEVLLQVESRGRQKQLKQDVLQQIKAPAARKHLKAGSRGAVADGLAFRAPLPPPPPPLPSISPQPASQTPSQEGPSLSHVDPLMTAFNTGNLVKLKQFLTLRGIYSEALGKKTIGDLAAERGSADVLELLHTMSFDFDRRNRDGMVPFHYAMKKQRLDVLRQLRELGASPDIALPSVSGKGVSDTPLHVACATSDKKLLEALLDHCGASLNVLDAQGNSPLHRACLEDSLISVKIIASRLTEQVLNMQGYEGKTALHIAVLNQNREIIRLLLTKQGALVDVPAANGKTVIDILLETSNHMIMYDFVFYYTKIKMNDVNATSMKELLSMPQFEQYLEFLSNVDNEFQECTMTLIDISPVEKDALCTKLQHDNNIDLIEFQEVILRLLHTQDIHSLIQDSDATVLYKVVENIVHYVLFKEDAAMLERIMCCGILWSKVSAVIEDNLDELYVQAPDREVNRIVKHFKAKFVEDDAVGHDKLTQHYGDLLSCYKMQPYHKESKPCCRYMRHPMSTLPVWSVLSGRLSLTELLLRNEKFDVIPLSLFCAALLRTFPDNQDLVIDRDDIEEMAIMCEKFARKAIEKVNSIDTSYNRTVSVDYLLRPLESYGGVSCVKLAASNQCANFLQSELCQRALDKMWFGSLLNVNPVLREFIIWMGAIPMNFAVPLLLLHFKDEEKDTRRNHEEKHFMADNLSVQRSTKFKLFSSRRQRRNAEAGGKWENDDSSSDLENFGDYKVQPSRKSSTALSRPGPDLEMAEHAATLFGSPCEVTLSTSTLGGTQCGSLCSFAAVLYKFYTTPAVKFRYHVAVHILLLVTMSYFLLMHFMYDICLAEVITYAILSGLLLEEIGEILQYVEHNDIHSYFKSRWNLIDLAALTSGVIGFVIRMIAIQPANNSLDMERDFQNYGWYAARIHLSISCTLYWIRLLYVSTILENLGPKLKMIAEMIMKDLLPFLLILFTFIMGFGVLMYSLLYPNGYRAWNPVQISSTHVLLGMLKICFYSMVGEYSLDSILGDESCSSIYQNATENTASCPHEAGRYLVPYLILPLYVIVTEILLLNLIIAMFSKTIETIDARSKDLWQFERYRLIEEFESRSGLPPPLNIFDLLRKLVLLIRKNCRLTLNRFCQRVQENQLQEGGFNQRLVLQFLLFQALGLRSNREDLMRQCLPKQETETEKMLLKMRDIVEEEVAKVRESFGDKVDGPESPVTVSTSVRQLSSSMRPESGNKKLRRLVRLRTLWK